MRIKRYVVDSMPDALSRIRSDLGKDAIILNTKEVRTGGFLGMFGKRQIEVIAATDSGLAGTAPAAGSGGGAAQEPADGRSAAGTRPPAPQEDASAAAMMNVLQQEAAHRAYAVGKGAAPATAGATVRAPLPAPAAIATKDREADLLNEIKEMKDMVHRLTVVRTVQAVYPKPFDAYFNRMVQQGVAPELAARAVEQAVAKMEEDSDGAPPEERARALLKAELGALTGDRERRVIGSGTRAVHFVGPTGVGKTTTIAKLAAEQVLKHNRKVGFVTSDTYRIAAVEQLKTYATILNVPMEVVFSPQEAEKAFHRLSDRDVIFMDTAGRNYRNEMYVSELNSLLAERGNSETFLVMSLTSKYKDMRMIADNFLKFRIDNVLFTKKDETDTYGSLINLLHDYPLHPSYITTGQNVPDDIEQLNMDRMYDLILEEPDNG